MTFRTIAIAIALLVTRALPTSLAAERTEPYIVAHRGLLRHAPENTIANFRACLELRIGFEFDVERTQDGHLICLHDTTVDRTTNGSGNVAEMKLAQIRRLDAGSWFDPRFAGEKVPTVDEVLRLIARYAHHDVLIAVDLKADGAGREVVQLADKHKVLDRLLFIGRTISDSELRKQIRETSSAAHTAAVANNAGEFETALEAAQADWVYLRFLPSSDQIEAVHQARKRAFIAGPTVSGHSAENWVQAIDAGIDAILTDYPLQLRTTAKGSATVRRSSDTPVTARLIARRRRYILPLDRHGDVFRRQIESETKSDNLPPAPEVDLVLELKNISQHDVMIWPRGAITVPELFVTGPGVVGPENLQEFSGTSSATSVQPTIKPGKTRVIRIKSLNPGGGTPWFYWCEPGQYSIRAAYDVYTNLPPFPFPNPTNQPTNKPQKFTVTTPPVEVEVVLPES